MRLFRFETGCNYPLSPTLSHRAGEKTEQPDALLHREKGKKTPIGSLSPWERVRKRGKQSRIANYSGSVCASTTASATILTIRRTDAIGVRICTGFATPISTGPTVTPSEQDTRSRL